MSHDLEDQEEYVNILSLALRMPFISVMDVRVVVV